MRDPEDDQGAREALDSWIRERPQAAIVVAAIDRLPDDTLDIAVKLSRLTGYELVGLVQALLQQAIDSAAELPGAWIRSSSGFSKPRRCWMARARRT